MKARSFLLMISLLIFQIPRSNAQPYGSSSYCNPLNIDYTYMVYNANQHLSYRSGADPAVVRFRGGYYMFVTRSMGYWYSQDLLHWRFINPEKWYFQGSNAPAAHNYKDSILYVTGDPSGSMSILYTDDPVKGDWKATPSIINDLQDPDLFIDDDGKAYMFWGSSNVFPIRARVLDKNDLFRYNNQVDTLFFLDAEEHGWERFGEDNKDAVQGYIEGAWLTKYNGIYYMQYAAPGTEFNVYGDGVYMADGPLGPYRYAPNNPVSFKPGGFINGAGHGSTVEASNGQFWHFSTMAVNVNIGWERRIGMFPTYFDKDGLMYCNMAFGDYPHYAPGTREREGQFRGWMLLSYDKPVEVSSVLGGFAGANLTDENVKTFWVAGENDSTQWVQIDLQRAMQVHAIQINYNDYKGEFYGRVPDLYQQYVIQGSVDGKSWFTILDKSKNRMDVPNDYTELTDPVETRFVRFRNIHFPGKYLSVSDIRVFGTGDGDAPAPVNGLQVKRDKDRRNALINWQPGKEVQGHNVYWGIAPDKLYNSWMVYKKNELDLRSLNKGQVYYFAIEAFNENGISERSAVIRVD